MNNEWTQWTNVNDQMTSIFLMTFAHKALKKNSMRKNDIRWKSRSRQIIYTLKMIFDDVEACQFKHPKLFYTGKL